MSNTGPMRPWWNRRKKRWIAIQIVNGVRKSSTFYTEEAAQKWYDAPLDHPHLPLSYSGSMKRNLNYQPIPRGFTITEDGLD